MSGHHVSPRGCVAWPIRAARARKMFTYKQKTSASALDVAVANSRRNRA